jgi:hypothetical protein
LIAALFFVIALLSGTPAFAQGNTGEIWGRVGDTNGNALGGGAVSITNLDTGTERDTHADRKGQFGFAALPPGRYRVTASHEGFASQRQDDIALLPGQRTQIELSLHEAPLRETIALNPYPPILESGRTHASGFVAETEIDGLPIEGRRYLRLAELTPAVTTDIETGGIRVMDLPSEQNRIVIDGFDHTSSITGHPMGGESPLRIPYQLSQSSVDALRVQTNGPPADNGRTGAAAIDVATKSGANAFHGSGYEFFGNRGLNGRTALDAQAGLRKPPFRSNQFGGIAGGPLLKNHSFFLVSYEGLRRVDTSLASPDLTPFAPVGTAALSGVAQALMRSPRDQDQDLLFARMDHDYLRQHVTIRYTDQQFTGRAIEPTRFQPALSSDGLADLRIRSGSGSLASTIGEALVNEARVQYAHTRDTEDPPSTPALVIWQGGSFVAQTGSSLYGPHRFATKRLQVADSVSWVTGPHSMKAGADVLKDRNAIAFGPLTTLGFQTIGRATTGSSGRSSDWLLQTLDTGTIHADANQYAAFLQDAWRVTPALTMDLGVRYDVQDFPDGNITTAYSNWAPRVGLAYAPGERRHVFRAAYGLFYGTTPALIPALSEAFSNDAPHTRPASLVVVDPSFKTSRVHQASAGWEVEKYRAGSFGAEYLFARGERLPRPVDINVNRRFAGVDRVVSFQSSGHSVYNGISVHARGRLLQQLFYTTTYTYSRSSDTPQQPIAMVFGGLNDRGSLSMQGNTLGKRAPSAADRHHDVSISTVYDTSMLAVNRRGLSKRLIANWEWGFVYSLQTGRPFSAYVNGDINGDGNAFNDLAPDTRWNQYRLPYQSSLDPRIARRFQIAGSRQLLVIWEAFNIWNRANYTAVDNTLYSVGAGSLSPNPLFGRKTAQANGRLMQLAARLIF